MKKMSRCLAVSAVLAAALPAHADVNSSFDSGVEGWTALTANLRSAGSPVVLASVALNYVPAGYITAADADFEDTLFVAPAAYLGNQGVAYGGSLSYSLTTDLAPDYVGSNVVLKGNGLTLIYALPTQPAVQNSWVQVSVPLSASALWHLSIETDAAPTQAQFQSVLGNLTALWISGETHNGLGEVSGIDNVRLAAVPEPGTAGLALLGLGALALRRRAAGCR